MKEYLPIFFGVIAVIGAIGVIITIYDKSASKCHRRRIPENFLIADALFGGAVPMLITMKIIHHKTRHKKFMLGLPAIILIQFLAALCLVFYKFF